MAENITVTPLELVRLTALMARSRGCSGVRIGLIDGPVATSQPDLAGARIEQASAASADSCSRAESVACQHGTFVAGMLVASRESAAPAICPECTLILRVIFPEDDASAEMPTATTGTLATAINDCIAAGADVINVSAATSQPSLSAERTLCDALDRAARSGVIVTAAAGNQGTLGGSAITRHPWVIPVAACNARRYPLDHSNLGRSIGRFGLSAPGERITSLGVNGQPVMLGGTSAATPFVTGAIALLWSEFPRAPASSIKTALGRAAIGRTGRAGVVPPVLDAWGAYEALARSNYQKGVA